uniref:Uncharacterized protein n=1 Tax=Timema shepardi TaxID=629360 RepID=A0A7R9G4V0_TIMSH|nr:unnamed protein product [Timema shepardi]
MGLCVLPRATPQVEQPRPPATPASNGGGGPSAVFPVPPGMSDYSFKRVTGENPFKPEELEQTKLGLVKFLSSGVVAESDILIHLAVAAADTRFSVANAADMELKKISGSTAARLTPVAGVLLSGLLKLIAEEDATLKALAYSAAGKLGSRVPHLVNKDLVLLQTFFQALSQVGNTAPLDLPPPLLILRSSDGCCYCFQEEADVRLAVREALLNMVDAFGTPVEAGAKGEEESSHEVLMQALLASQVESEEPMARFVAVRYASTVFPATHVPSRYLLLLACGDSKDEVFTEALKSLYGSSKQKTPEGGSEEGPGSKMELPPFKEMACYLAEKSAARTQNTATRYTVGSHVLPYPPKTYAAMLNYLRLCLARSAGVPITFENAQFPGPHAPQTSRYLRSLYESEPGRGALQEYLTMVEQLLTANGTTVPLACLVEVVGSIPDLLAPKYLGKLAWFKVHIS